MAIVRKLYNLIHIWFIVTLLATQSLQQSNNVEEENPFVEAAKVLLQNQLNQNQGGSGGGQILSGILSNFMQSDGGKHLGDMLMGAGKSDEGAAAASDILSGLGSLLASATNNEQNPDRTGGGLDPQLIGNMLSLFASNQAGNGEDDINNNIDVNNNEVRRREKPAKEEEGFDWEGVIGLVSNVISQQGNADNKGGGGGGGIETILNLLPILMGNNQQPSININNNHHQKHNHQNKPSYLPPFLDNLYEYWEHFSNSELGQTLWKNSGLGAIVKLFTDKNGRFEVDRIFNSLENNSFRRRWIKSLASFVGEWVSHVSDPATQTRYLTTAQFVGNSFLKAQGYGKAAMFDPQRPAESLSHLANAVFKRQFGLKVNSATYIKPAVSYIQDVFRLGQSKGLILSRLDSQQIESRMAETLNLEVIEPVLRVWRAFRYGTRQPQCDRYVICVVNQPDPSNPRGEGLKPGITKLASMVASWFLSGNTGTPFWQLYNAAVEQHNCPEKYPVDCSDFHAEDIRATTEYSHSEL